MIIYKIENKTNGHIYIGQTQRTLNSRIGYHRYSNRFPIGRAFQKYGFDNFAVAIIDYAYSKQELDEKEKFWIRVYNSKVPNGYNLTDGGEGREGYKLPEEVKQKISAAQKGRKGKKQSPEFIEKRISKIRGRKNTPETIAKMSDAAKKRNPISDETKAKMSEVSKLRGVAPELIARLKVSRIGKKNTPEMIAKMLETRFANRELRKAA